jgi:iron complex outermembrane receptor protein
MREANARLMRRSCRLETVLVAVAAFTFRAASVHAQNAPEPAAQDQLESVVVTARYTQENVQATPVAITAITGADLEERNLTNVTTLGNVVPNLYTHPGDAAEGLTPTITLRGVSSGDYNFTFDPSVGIYIDDVYHNSLFGSALDLMDLDRVEVLRGPQGTLFGNASIGGAIRLFSKTPKGDDTGYLDATYGSYHRVDIKGAFDTAIVPDTLFLRVSGVTKRQDGYVDQLDFTCEMKALGTPQLSGTFPTSDTSTYQRGCKIGAFGGTNLNALRAMLRYVASEKLEFNFQATYSKEDDEVTPEVLIDAHPATNDGFDSVYNNMVFQKYGIYYSNVFLPPPGNPYSSYASFTSPLRPLSYQNENAQNSTDFSGTMDYDIASNVHLKTIVAYSNYNGVYNQNPDLSPLALAYAYGTFNVDQGTAEVRLTGNLFDGKFEWATGLFYLRAAEFLGGAQTFVLIAFDVDDRTDVNSRSAFLHGIYHLTDKLSFTAGGRFSDDDKSYSFDHPGLLVIPTPFEAKANNFDWLAGLNYQFTKDLMSYFTVSTGSRPPGVFARPVTIYQLSPIPPEQLTSYEVGLKSEFFEHRLRLNLASYYSDYSKHQTYLNDYECLGQAPPPTPVTSPSLCPPGGSVTWGLYISTPAKDEGVELEATAEPVPGLLLNLDGGYNDYRSGVTTPGAPGYIFPGNVVQPHWNISGGAQYDARSPIGTFTPRLDWTYLSMQTFNPSVTTATPGSQYIIPGRSVFNARVTYEPNNSKWSTVFSVTNLGNKYYYYDLFTGSGFDTAGNLAPPREWSLSVHRRF